MLAAALAAALAAPQDPALAPRTFALPDDPRAVVLSYDWRDGTYTWDRETERPYLEVYADGTIVAPDRSGGDAHLVDRLAADELQELLRFVIDEQGLLEFRDTYVAGKILRPDIVEYRSSELPPTVAVAIDLPQHRGEARYARARQLARQYPEIGELVSFAAVEARLDGLRTQLRLGGRERASELLAVVNEQIAAEAPELAPLAWDDVPATFGRRAVTYVYIEALIDERRVRFERVEGDGSVLAATLSIPGDGEPSVHIELERS